MNNTFLNKRHYREIEKKNKLLKRMYMEIEITEKAINTILKFLSEDEITELSEKMQD